VYGQDDTLGDSLVLSGVHNNISCSFGQFHYETDGFRKNNDQEIDVYNVFFQASLNHKTSVQAEYRYNETDQGDMEIRFDPDDIRKDLRRGIDNDTFRLGFHHRMFPGFDLLGSFIYQDREDNLYDKLTVIEFNGEAEEDGFNAELQNFFHSDRLSITSGAGYFEADSKITITDTRSTFPSRTYDDDIDHTNLYLYSLINYPRNVTWTIGASGDFFNGGVRDRDQFNPKFGFTWNPLHATTVRGAVFRTFKRSLISSQTLEPTQVNGFNQFFDDSEGADAWRYGIGVDQKFTEKLFGGIELSQRDLEFPVEFIIPIPPKPSITEIREMDWEERLARAYLYWTPHPWLAGSVEFVYERFERDRDFPVGVKDLETYRFPLGINFYHPSGFGLHLQATYVDQEAEYLPANYELGRPFTADDDNFWLVDGSLSYRLPKRLGIIRLEAKNLLDESFNVWDIWKTESPIPAEPSTPFMQLERLILLRVTLAF
jgi:opacity protein-like surface antigen